MSDIRFGILGCGLAAGFHAHALRAAPDAVLAGVYDRDPAKCASFAEAHGCTAYRSFEALAADGGIDAVCVCTPSGCHAENAVTLLEHGKALLIEKPIAVDPVQANRILAAAKQANLTVGVVSQMRCCDDVKRLKAAVEAGVLGRPVSAQLTMLYHRSKAYYRDSDWHGTLSLDGGGALINQGIHGVDLLLWLMGRVKRVWAHSATLRHEIEAEDTVSALLEFENGCIATLSAATSVWPGQPRRLSLCGTRGSAVLTEDRLTSLATRDAGELIDGRRSSAYLSHTDPGAIPPEAHENVIRDFCDALKEGRAPISDAVDGCNALMLIRAVYEAAAAGESAVPEYIPKEETP